MKVLFLDVDGVLNSWRDHSSGIDPLNPGSCGLLREVLQQTGAKVVLSSTWRMWDDAWTKLLHNNTLTMADFVMPVFKTPVLDTRRGEEIEMWLVDRHEDYGDVERFAIIDDDHDMLPKHKPFFVQTSMDKGMCQVHADKLIEILNGPPLQYIPEFPTC